MWAGQIITNVEELTGEVKLSEHKNIPNRDGQVIHSGLIVSNICAVTCMYGM